MQTLQSKNKTIRINPECSSAVPIGLTSLSGTIRKQEKEMKSSYSRFRNFEKDLEIRIIGLLSTSRFSLVWYKHRRLKYVRYIRQVDRTIRQCSWNIFICNDVDLPNVYGTLTETQVDTQSDESLQERSAIELISSTHYYPADVSKTPPRAPIRAGQRTYATRVEQAHQYARIIYNSLVELHVPSTRETRNDGYKNKKYQTHVTHDMTQVQPTRSQSVNPNAFGVVLLDQLLFVTSRECWFPICSSAFKSNIYDRNYDVIKNKEK